MMIGNAGMSTRYSVMPSSGLHDERGSPVAADVSWRGVSSIPLNSGRAGWVGGTHRKGTLAIAFNIDLNISSFGIHCYR